MNPILDRTQQEWSVESEIRAACAKAVGWAVNEEIVRSVNYGYALIHSGYNPLSNDEQAMYLVKKFKLRIDVAKGGNWLACNTSPSSAGFFFVEHESLNRAICECVSRLPPP